jgi:hypothetical protein
MNCLRCGDDARTSRRAGVAEVERGGAPPQVKRRRWSRSTAAHAWCWSIQNLATPAVGTCTTGGGGVCTDHGEFEAHPVGRFAAVGAAREYLTMAVTCAAWAPVMTAQHHDRYRAGTDRPGV